MVKEEQKYGLLLKRKMVVILSQGSLQHMLEEEREVLWLFFESLDGKKDQQSGQVERLFGKQKGRTRHRPCSNLDGYTRSERLEGECFGWEQHCPSVCTV